MKRWERVRRRDLFRSPVFRIREDTVVSPRTGEELPFYVLECDDWVNVVAFTADDRLILVRQFRQGREEFSLEIPGGVVEAGEDPAEAARRELREETGYGCEAVTPLGWVAPNPAIQTNRCHTYLARGCRYEGEPTPDEGEDLEVELLPAGEVRAAILDGRIRHSLAVVGLCLHAMREG